MCGIAGVVLREARVIDPGFAAVQFHRGPDSQGMLLSDGEAISFHSRVETQPRAVRLALIHHRLSIIDLSDLGRQPMSTPDGRFHLIYNGEIYNYVELRRELELAGVKFVSQSDTEVVLHALANWGKGALNRFEGMFAIGLWDAHAYTLMLARDFFGIKPLHYHQSADRFAFASEMKALLSLEGVDRNLNPRATFEFLRHGLTDHDSSTLIAGIEQLEPGCWVEVNLDRPGEARRGRYWKLERIPVNLTFDDAAAHLRTLFLRNVDRHLRSDVQVGTALSGGIDSSAIVSAVRYLQPGVDMHTFSYIASDEQLSEEKWVDIVVEHTGATVHKIRLGAEDMINDLEELIDAQDQPFSSTSIYAQFCVFRAARNAGIKVMLDGQGADELLGGYSNFMGARLASLVARGQVTDAVRFLSSSSRNFGMRNLLLTAGPYLLPESLQKPLRELVGRELVPAWLNEKWFRSNGENFAPATSRKFSKSIYFNELERATNISLPHLLRYEDRNSMYFSIESRVPFLTPELARFVISVPDEFSLAPDGTRKSLFRKAMRGIVPDPILDRSDKIGFATPEKNWLSELDPWINSVFRRARKWDLSPIELDELEDEWRSVKAGRKRFDNHIWRCINLLVWVERHGVRMLDG